MANKRKVLPRMTESEFELIKGALNAGYNRYHMQQVSHRGAGTLIRVQAAKDFKDYQRLTKNEYLKYQAKQSVVKESEIEKQIETIRYGLAPTEEVKQPEAPEVTLGEDKHLVQLTRIADAMERLAEAWEQQPKNKGLFR